VAFNEKLKLNDGLLISTFAYDTKMTAGEAHQQVEAFVRQLQEELHTHQRFELRGVGLFRLNAEQKIEFEYVASGNFLNDSFGLPELITRPVVAADAAAGLRTLLKEQQANRAVSTAKPSLRRKIRSIYDTAAVLAIGGLSCSALYFISLQTDYNLSSLIPFSLVGQPAKVERAAEAPVTESLHFTEDLNAGNSEVMEKEAELMPERLAPPEGKVAETSSPGTPAETAPVTVTPAKEEKKEPVKAAPEVAAAPVITPKAPPVAPKKNTAVTINTATNRYYIIAGGYSSLKNARWGLKQLTGQGGKGTVILPVNAGDLHRVSVQDYASKVEALQHLPELKKKFGNNIWILNY
jgi:cell division septation protein DedD